MQVELFCRPVQNQHMHLLVKLMAAVTADELTPQPSCMLIFSCESSQVHIHTNK